MRKLSPWILGLFLALSAGGIFWLAYRYFESEEISKAEGRLSLYRSTVVAEIERFSHLTQVLASDPFVMQTAAGAPAASLDARLKGFADAAELDAIYLMDPGGLTISASNADETRTFKGQEYGFRPYFQTALGGTQGRFYGIGATTGLPGYFIADAVRGPSAETLGVIALQIDLSKLQDAWRSAGEQVFLADKSGIVLLSSDPDWLYRATRELNASQITSITESRQFPGQDLNPLDWRVTAQNRAEINGTERLHLVARDLPHGWSLHYFASDDRAVARSSLVAGLFVMIAGAVLIAVQIQRTRRIRRALNRSTAEEIQLRLANDRLAQEIDVRRAAEQQLQQAQGELAQASRLAALGQLAASVTHELGQPIAAMRNHLAAVELAPSSMDGLTGRLGSLVDRMEGITRQLKFFARTEDEEFASFDLRAAMEAALMLVAPNIERLDVSMTRDFDPQPVMMRGNRLRLEQVMTNVLRNACDAMEDAERRTLHVGVGQSADQLWFEITDNGHGLGSATLADLREPFVTTRESGRGMGLGLAISATIVEDHGGRMQAINVHGGGACFRVSFDRAGIMKDAAE